MQDFLRILKNFHYSSLVPFGSRRVNRNQLSGLFFFRIFLCCLDQSKFQKNPVNIRYAADISQCFRSCHNRLSFRLFKCQPHRAPRKAFAVFPPVNPEFLRQLAVSSGFQLIGKRQSGNCLKRISLICNNAVPEMLLVVVFVEGSQ